MRRSIFVLFAVLLTYLPAMADWTCMYPSQSKRSGASLVVHSRGFPTEYCTTPNASYWNTHITGTYHKPGQPSQEVMFLNDIINYVWILDKENGQPFGEAPAFQGIDGCTLNENTLILKVTLFVNDRWFHGQFPLVCKEN